MDRSDWQTVLRLCRPGADQTTAETTISLLTGVLTSPRPDLNENRSEHWDLMGNNSSHPIRTLFPFIHATAAIFL